MGKVCGKQNLPFSLSSSPSDPGILPDVAQDHLERHLYKIQAKSWIFEATDIQSLEGDKTTDNYTWWHW